MVARGGKVFVLKPNLLTTAGTNTVYGTSTDSKKNWGHGREFLGYPTWNLAAHVDKVIGLLPFILGNRWVTP